MEHVITISPDEIIIDEEFKRILPPLDVQTYARLEEEILEYGCLLPLILWNGILVDGHHRHSILVKHNIPLSAISMDFDSRDEVLIWIVSTQIARRNLNPMQLSFYRGLHYNMDKKIQGGQVDHPDQSDTLPGKTAVRLAEQYNVSAKTIRRDAQVANAIIEIGELSPDIKMNILYGKTYISRQQLQDLSIGSPKNVATVVEQINEGTFEGRRRNTSPDTQDLSSMPLWEQEFVKMTDTFRQSIKAQEKPDDTGAVKTALRDYISMLEDLYHNI